VVRIFIQAKLCRERSHMPRLVSLRSVAGLGSLRVGGYGGRQQPVEAVQVFCRIEVKLDPVPSGRITPDGGISTEAIPDPQPPGPGDPQIDHPRRLQASNFTAGSEQGWLIAITRAPFHRWARREHGDNESLPQHVTPVAAHYSQDKRTTAGQSAVHSHACRDDDARPGGRSGFDRAGRVRLEVFRAVFDRGPHIGDPACIWQGSGGSVSVEGTRGWYSRGTPGPGVGRAGRRSATWPRRDDGGRRRRPALGRPVAARTAGPGNQIDVVSNQYV
jgi:hypothetical protein